MRFPLLTSDRSIVLLCYTHFNNSTPVVRRNLICVVYIRSKRKRLIIEKINVITNSFDTIKETEFIHSNKNKISRGRVNANINIIYSIVSIVEHKSQLVPLCILSKSSGIENDR